MAVEALQVNKNKEGENNIPVKERTPEPVNVPNQDERDKNRYEQLLVKHSIPDTEKFSHKQEQLFLMVSQKLTDTFIGKVINFPSDVIDMLRMAVFVTGEDYLFSLISDQVPSEEQIRSWIKDYMKTSLAPEVREPAGTAVERSLDIMGRHMVRQQEIAGDQINRLTEYLKRMSEMVQERSENDLATMRAENQKERERAQKQIDLLSDENFRLSMKIEDAQEEERRQAEEKKQQLTAAGPEGNEVNRNYPDRDEGLFAHRRRMKEKRRREEFISSVLGNGNFSKEQLVVIERVVHKNFSLQQLQRICDPQVKPENMELLEAYYEKRRVHG